MDKKASQLQTFILIVGVLMSTIGHVVPAAAFVSGRSVSHRTTFLRESPYKQGRYESSMDYYKRLAAMLDKEDTTKSPDFTGSSPSSTGLSMSASSNSTESGPPPPPRYQRIEEWNQQHTSSTAWQEKVQWEGQQHGNRLQQHDILRKHLKGL